MAALIALTMSCSLVPRKFVPVMLNRDVREMVGVLASLVAILVNACIPVPGGVVLHAPDFVRRFERCAGNAKYRSAGRVGKGAIGIAFDAAYAIGPWTSRTQFKAEDAARQPCADRLWPSPWRLWPRGRRWCR